MFGAKDRPLQVAAISCRPASLAAPPRISRKFRQDSKMRLFFFNGLRTLLSALKLQAPYFHSLPHSLKFAQNVTPVFAVSSSLFLRSFARVRYSTLLFSSACTLFCEKVGVARTSVMLRSAPLRATATFINCSWQNEMTYSATARQNDHQGDRTEPKL